METIKLNNGIEMPMIGYGVWQIAPEDCCKYVSEALKAGYRSIDTALAKYLLGYDRQFNPANK